VLLLLLLLLSQVLPQPRVALLPCQPVLSAVSAAGASWLLQGHSTTIITSSKPSQVGAQDSGVSAASCHTGLGVLRWCAD
jgi:hypothetical protein